MVDANPPEGLGENDPIPMAHLGGRRYESCPLSGQGLTIDRYLAIRGCSRDAVGRSSRQQQEALIKEVWKKTERIHCYRPL